ncbi:MAG: TonB-dependent receptor [Saprospiraceae bacterium]|nr:TonB-dependent receptor [Pyrinomonadaceae bacterium]
MRKSFTFISMTLTILFCLFAVALGQETTGNLEGTLKDSAGAVVPNVSVTISTAASRAGQGFNRTVTADESGFFRVLQIPPGNYIVSTAAAGGFGEYKNETVQISLGKTTQLNIELGVAGSVNTVDVAVSDQPVDTTGSEISTSLTAQKIDLLPKGVDFTTALKAVPGTRPDPIAGGFTVDGATNSENSFIIDGQEVTNYRMAGINANNMVPFPIVQELQVKSSGFEAEYGGATGGVINVVTKGGNNEYRGEVGMQFNTSKFNGDPRPTLLRFTNGLSGAAFRQSTELFNAPKAASLNFFPTVNLSGPIIKDRLWFFGSYSPQILETTVDTTFYTNQPAATRTVVSTDTYRQKVIQQYAFGRLDAQPIDKLRLSGTYLWNPVITEGLLPFGTASFGGSDPAVDFGGNIGLLSGSDLRKLQGGRNNANNVTGQAVYTILDNLVATFRFSRGFLNEKANNYFVPTGNQYVCTNGGGSTTVPGACAPNFTSPNTTINLKDVSVRTTYEGDATVLFDLGGRHQLKGGYSRSTIFNDQAAGFSQTIILCYGDFRINNICGGSNVQSSSATPDPNAIGGGVLRRFGQIAEGSNLNQSIYVQDKYQPFRRLTLNLGIRIEKEDIPSFNEFPASFSFGYGDKVAPRLGVAYDLFGDGKNKIFGSYGKFFDRLKFRLAQGSFGGDFFRDDYFDIMPNSGPYTNFTTASIVGNFTDPIGGSCPGTGFIGSGLSRCQTDLRIASNNPDADPFESGAIDPDLKPYEQREFTVGFEREMGRSYVLRARYTNKKLINAIEDAGVADEGGSEVFITGNPGQGLHKEFLEAGGYEGPYATPRRRYDAMEIVFEKRLSNNYFFNLNYTLSRLYGNYSGLANTDELTGSLNGLSRSDPGVNRNFDLPFIGFTAAGGFDDGRLASDRPHVFNAYGSYTVDWKGANSTDFSLFQTVQSGTPQTTFIQFGQATTIFTKRGDLGRSPTFSQTDLGITHRYKFGRDNRFTVVGDFNVLNLLDQETVLTVQNLLTSGQIARAVAFPQFFDANGQNEDKPGLINAYNRGELLAQINTYLAGTPTALSRTRADFNQPNRFQAPRSVRFGFRFLF